jgi:hypothetical protein
MSKLRELVERSRNASAAACPDGGGPGTSLPDSEAEGGGAALDGAEVSNAGDRDSAPAKAAAATSSATAAKIVIPVASAVERNIH